MEYGCILTLEDLQAYLSGASIAAFDFETAPDDAYRSDDRAALDAHKSHIAGISFSVAEGDAVYLPLAHRIGENAADQDAIWGWLKPNFFMNSAVTKIAHNLAFESAFLYAKGIVVQEPCYDTIAAAQLVYKNEKEFRSLGDCGLKTLVPEYFGEQLPSYTETVSGLHFDELDPQAERTVRYARSDSDYALRLYHLFNNWFDRFLPKHRFITEKIESPTAVYVGLMRYNGLPIDRPLMEQKGAEAEKKLADLRRDIAFIIGDVSIGANASTAAFKKYLFDRLKLPKVKQTEKERDALDDEALILLKEYCEKNRPELVRLFELVQEYRRWGKIKSTYIDGYLKYVNTATGRIHPDLLPLATETGRFASKNPNCQNMPRAGADDIGVRNFITAPEGKLLLSLDFSQIELRVGAFYCKDEKMLETYRSGGDIHAQTTSVIYKIPLEQAKDKNAPEYKERRTIAKNCNFGTFFGLYPKGLQKTLKFKAGLDVSLDECDRIIRSLKSGYPRLSRWQEETKRRAEFRKYTETWLGRRRSLPGITSTNWNVKSFAQRVAMNTPIQGTAADILKLALGRIVRGLPERSWLCPLLQIHDELVFELPENQLKEAVLFIKTCMETQPFEAFSVPIVADAAAGKRFGELRELEGCL
ncbi:bifunctional 3'-5' exonuclease/DNA polymerase [Caproiciproducens sp. NJN-50]|uniref:bifunctional 3'-5' exonuclease/DNA polymerase n=1 Tax=Caproiciproducens sp. NJN-50 TaxID=2507162 RepID=UPI000FFDFC25|nr:bifunctional 3'-5' exonuclease/DNA polymerase [Caproiciproducens sp. NJN-50]QAT49554.1 bifunctional 3'-5' exonuclease/DNA polymerase [Caproiciproducens sp. NJN-50]